MRRLPYEWMPDAPPHQIVLALAELSLEADERRAPADPYAREAAAVAAHEAATRGRGDF
jgi:hypothetical protein